MQKLTQKLNIFTFVAILFMVFTISFLVFETKVNACTSSECVRNVEISCYSNPRNVDINESVTWTAVASYGTGYYTYSWSGTNGLFGNSSSVSKSYSSSGTKTARVAVTSGGKTFYKNCGSVVVDRVEEPPVCGDECVRNVEISCSADRSNIDVNESVTWRAIASYGTGYYTYSWSGTNGLSGNSSNVTKTYTSSGTKTARVAVTSGGKTFYKDCGSIVVDRVEDEDETLTGSCDVDDSNIETGEYVEWSARASGGTGSYTYSWSGSSPLSGKTGRDVSVRYSSEGTKTGKVTIRSGNQSITRNCGTIYVEDDNDDYDDEDLTLSCNVNNSNILIGQNVIWNAYANGGNGRYRYSWSGTDGISGSNSSVSKSFNTLGTKYATVRVTSDGKTRSLTCPVVVVGNVGYQNPNQGNLAGLTSVYLNQVPYTGVEDNPKFWAFIVGLFAFSALGAYVIVSKKAKSQRLNKILEFKNENMAKRGLGK